MNHIFFNRSFFLVSLFAIIVFLTSCSKPGQLFELNARQSTGTLQADLTDPYRMTAALTKTGPSEIPLSFTDSNGVTTEVVMHTRDTLLKFDWYTPVCHLEADISHSEQSLSGKLTFY